MTITVTMTKIIAVIVMVIVMVGAFAPSAFAQGRFLPCKATECTLADFITFIKNVITFLLQIIIPLGVIMIVWGGFVIMTAGGNPGKVDSGKKIITAAVIGIAIAFGSWLIVTTINRILTGFF